MQSYIYKFDYIKTKLLHTWHSTILQIAIRRESQGNSSSSCKIIVGKS